MLKFTSKFLRTPLQHNFCTFYALNNQKVQKLSVEKRQEYIMDNLQHVSHKHIISVLQVTPNSQYVQFAPDFWTETQNKIKEEMPTINPINLILICEYYSQYENAQEDLWTAIENRALDQLVNSEFNNETFPRMLGSLQVKNKGSEEFFNLAKSYVEDNVSSFNVRCLAQIFALFAARHQAKEADFSELSDILFPYVRKYIYNMGIQDIRFVMEASMVFGQLKIDERFQQEMMDRLMKQLERLEPIYIDEVVQIGVLFCMTQSQWAIPALQMIIQACSQHILQISNHQLSNTCIVYASSNNNFMWEPLRKRLRASFQTFNLQDFDHIFKALFYTQQISEQEAKDAQEFLDNNNIDELKKLLFKKV